MKKAIIDLNCKDRDYKFSLSVVTEKDWSDFVHEVVLNKGENIKILTTNGFKIVIRDNKAKFKVYYQDSFYHEIEYHIDMYGRASRDYSDSVSKLWQSIMVKYYGKEYQDSLSVILKPIEKTV